ncbi:MAG: DUF3791 domain-containing protein [Oscillospiraceae bacterium]|jgi:hypothetical protein|nr:DUF3791 domain-containing protein [Oscillospiraceae bacterium]
MSRVLQKETDRAVWLVNVVQFTAEELDMSVSDTLRLLDYHGLVTQVLAGYKVLHTQGYEYMAELLTDELRKVGAAT